ncbi:MAG: succinate dehydrogenase, cytochrome b556 subunit [Pseudomonadota bacterium]
MVVSVINLVELKLINNSILEVLMKQQQRPVYLDLPKIATKMSITAKISILHRISGVLMFLGLPLVLALFHHSLTNETFFANCYSVSSCLVMKLVFIGLIWAIMHHMCAGIRFLLLDIHIGIERNIAQKSARIVIIISLILTAILGVLIW